MAVEKVAGLELFRPPDARGADWAVWYGPAGEEGDVATAVARTGPYQYRIGEVQDVRGLIDDPGDNFLVTTVTIDLDDAAQESLGIDGDSARARLDRVSEEKKLRMAAGLGAGYISERGGDEHWASTLADGIAEVA